MKSELLAEYLIEDLKCYDATLLDLASNHLGHSVFIHRRLLQLFHETFRDGILRLLGELLIERFDQFSISNTGRIGVFIEDCRVASRAGGIFEGTQKTSADSFCQRQVGQVHWVSGETEVGQLHQKGLVGWIVKILKVQSIEEFDID